MVLPAPFFHGGIAADQLAVLHHALDLGQRHREVLALGEHQRADPGQGQGIGGLGGGAQDIDFFLFGAKADQLVLGIIGAKSDDEAIGELGLVEHVDVGRDRREQASGRNVQREYVIVVELEHLDGRARQLGLDHFLDQRERVGDRIVDRHFYRLDQLFRARELRISSRIAGSRQHPHKAQSMEAGTPSGHVRRVSFKPAPSSRTHPRKSRPPALHVSDELLIKRPG